MFSVVTRDKNSGTNFLLSDVNLIFNYNIRMFDLSIWNIFNRHIILYPFPPGMHQLFSQGTADLLLDACSEFWNGQDLISLNEVDR